LGTHGTVGEKKLRGSRPRKRTVGVEPSRGGKRGDTGLVGIQGKVLLHQASGMVREEQDKNGHKICANRKQT